jgi:hypothetical protein
MSRSYDVAREGVPASKWDMEKIRSMLPALPSVPEKKAIGDLIASRAAPTGSVIQNVALGFFFRDRLPWWEQDDPEIGGGGGIILLVQAIDVIEVYCRPKHGAPKIGPDLF